jgi:hypothetical protein
MSTNNLNESNGLPPPYTVSDPTPYSTYDPPDYTTSDPPPYTICDPPPYTAFEPPSDNESNMLSAHIEYPQFPHDLIRSSRNVVTPTYPGNNIETGLSTHSTSPANHSSEIHHAHDRPMTPTRLRRTLAAVTMSEIGSTRYRRACMAIIVLYWVCFMALCLVMIHVLSKNEEGNEDRATVLEHGGMAVSNDWSFLNDWNALH